MNFTKWSVLNITNFSFLCFRDQTLRCCFSPVSILSSFLEQWRFWSFSFFRRMYYRKTQSSMQVSLSCVGWHCWFSHRNILSLQRLCLWGFWLYPWPSTNWPPGHIIDRSLSRSLDGQLVIWFLSVFPIQKMMRCCGKKQCLLSDNKNKNLFRSICEKMFPAFSPPPPRSFCFSRYDRYF